MIGDAAQYQELATLYSSYGDGELIELGRGMADLTETAQKALKSELMRRGLKVAPARNPSETQVLTDEDLADMRTYAESAPDECIFDFVSEEGAAAAYYALTREGIKAIVTDGAKSDNRRPRVVVTPKDAAQAAAILSEPSQDELTAPTEETPADFALPRCPSCGGEDTLLESVEPVNQWCCDDCGHTWLEESASPFS